MDDQAGLHGDRLLDIGGGVTANSIGGLYDRHFDSVRQLDGNGFAVDEQDGVGAVLNEEFFLRFAEVGWQNGVLKRLRVHKVVAFVVNIAEIEALRLGVAELNRVGRAKFGGRSGVVTEVAQRALDESRLAPLGTVLHFDDRVWSAVE